MADWKNRKVLVTGAGGFIGSHLTERLLELGADVTAFLRYNSRHDDGFLRVLDPKLTAHLTKFYGELRELDTVQRAMKGIEVVFNLAALPGIPYSYLHPNETIETNVIGTLNALTAARAENVSRFVQTSTSEVYGSALYVPIDEAHPKQPQSPYSASKISSDAIALSYYYSFNLPVAIIRPFNTYGPRQSGRAVIPTIITQALTMDEIKLGNLDTTRDLTFVKDTVEGFVRVAESDAAVGQEINVGCGFEIRIGDLAKKIIELTGRDVKLSIDQERVRPTKSEVQRLFCANQKAKELLGWEPQYDLDAGLRATMEWFHDPDHLRYYDPARYTV
ncbi:MAG TPA: GDP-mannose 4,6-dehydratase [Thermoanaerobaculia bacterium]|nr:GDP-mannose 4,6-dehydratase [Thermoanaerobaculia bacterium]